MYEGIVQDLIDELGRLPGVGPKSAQRIAFHIVQTQSFDVSRLAKILLEVRERVRFCVACGNIADGDECGVCRDARRDRSLICVVEEPKDVAAIERTREYGGLYHVLGGAISPIDGIGPDDLSIRPLLQRLESGEVQEIIIATDPNLEGDATAAYLSRLLGAMDVAVSRLASGLPVGGDLEYADEVTLGRAFSGRRSLARRTPPPAAAPAAPAVASPGPAAAASQTGTTGDLAGGRPSAEDRDGAGTGAPSAAARRLYDDQPAALPKRPADPRDDRGPRIALGGRPAGNAPRRPGAFPVSGNGGPAAGSGSGWPAAPASQAPRRATDPPAAPDAWADER